MVKGKYKSLLTDSALYGLGIFLMKGISLIMLPVYTNYLSPTDYGRLEVLVILANVLSIFIGFGLVEALCRFVGLASNQDDKKRYAGECLLLALVIALVSYFFFAYFSFEIASLLPGNISSEEFHLLAIALAIGGLINIPLAWLRITERAFLFFQVTMLKVVLQVALTCYWLWQGWGMNSILAAGAVSAVVVAVLLCVIQIKETGLAFSANNLQNIAKYSAPILIGGVATFALSGMDRWILAEHFGAKQIAAYAIAIKFALVPTLLIQPFTLWWYPKRFSVLKEQDGIKANAHFAMLGAIIAVLICGLLGLVGPMLIHFLTPSEFHSASVFLPWLLLCTLFKLIAELLNLGCYVDKNSQVQMHINLVSCAIGACLLVLLVPKFMVIGAVASLLVANFLRMTLFFYYSQKRIYLPYKYGYLSSAFVVTFVAFCLGQYSEDLLWLAMS